MEPHENPLNTELSELLKKVISPEGVPQRGYLHTPDGKKILELAVALDLSWKETCARLKFAHATIQQALFVHGIKRKRKQHVLWSSERIACVERYYRESWSVHTREESRALQEKMFREVSMLPGGAVSLNAVNSLARRHEWGHWGKGVVLPKSTSKATELQLAKTVERRMAELIRQGVLVSSGADALCDTVQQEFEEAARATPLSLSKKSLQKRLLKLVWTKEAESALQEVVRMRFKVEEKFCPLFPHIPLEMVKIRERWHKGVIKATKPSESAQPGIGRIRARKELGDLTKFRMPQTDSKNPFIAKVATGGKNFSIAFLNGANMGVRHGGDIVGNPVRRALSDADFRGDALLIATNIVSFDLKKAGGPRKIGRALVMGDNVNPNIFADPIYRADVEHIVRDKPLDEVVYQTAEELLHNVLSGWHKVCIKPNRKPEYTGPVCIVFGINEEELAKSVAYWEIRYWTLLKQLELEAEKSITASALKQAVKNGNQKQAAALEKELEVVQERYNRTTITNVATQEAQRFYEHARALVVREIEQAIPNAKVIGQGTTYLEIDGEKIEVSIPSHDRVTDTLLKDYAARYGSKNLRGGLAPTVVICSPWGMQFRMTGREADYDGERGSAKVFVAPILVDDAYLQGVLADVIRQEHPLAKAVSSGQFQPGMLRLSRVNGTINADIIAVSALEAHERYPRTRAIAKKGNGEKKCVSSPYCRGPKFIWVHTATDQHWGGRAKEFVTEKESGKRLGMAEAVFHMMRREGLCEGVAMPVHLFSSNDDPTQGQNFKARTQPDPHELSPQEIERQMLNIRARANKTEKPEELRAFLGEMERLSAYQIEKRGTDFLLHQMKQMMERHIKANVDIFSAILRRAKKAGLILRGVGEFGNAAFGGFDTRNVGVLNFGGGNHFEHTVEGELIEGPFYADYLRLLLLALPEWKDAGNFLERAVVSPHYSGQAMGWGTMRIGKGYEYGLDLRDTPPRMGGWGDPLYGAVKNDPQRGNYSRIFDGKMTLKTYGDKHFFAAVATPYAFYHMCAAGTHTDRYGEHGFPPNNTGVSFVGLPVDGPDSGPILLRILPYDVIKDFVEDNPRPFDWGAFLPNPA